VQELTDVVSELVELAGDNSGDRESPEEVALADLAVDVVARARRRTGRVIGLSTIGDATVLARRRRWRALSATSSTTR